MILSMMQAKAFDVPKKEVSSKLNELPKEVSSKLNELTTQNDQLREKINRIEKLWGMVKSNVANPWLTPYIEQWVIFHQTDLLRAISYWKIAVEGESSQSNQISASHKDFEGLHTKYTHYLGQVCWRESQNFSKQKPWSQNTDPLPLISERYTKTAHYASQMKSSLDPLCKSIAQFSLS